MFAGKESSPLPQDIDSVQTAAPRRMSHHSSEAAIRAAVGKAHAVLWKGSKDMPNTGLLHATPTALRFGVRHSRDRGFSIPDKDLADLIEFSTDYCIVRERFLRGRVGPSH